MGILPNRNSHQRFSIRKDVLKNFTKFTEKHPCQSLFFNKIAGLRPEVCNFIKQETLAQVFFCEFCEIFKNTYFTEHLWVTTSHQRRWRILNFLMFSKEKSKNKFLNIALADFVKHILQVRFI